MVLLKVLGIVLLVFGFWLIRYFPGIRDYQRAGFAKSGIFIGLLIILAGVILLVVG